MDTSYLHDAFKDLSILDEEVFDINQTGELEKADDFMKEEPEDIIDVMDMDFEDVETEDGEDNVETHIGDVIFDCPVCHSKVYKHADEVELDEDEEFANVGEECPYCYSADGFKIVGQVAPYQPEDEVTIDIEDKEEIEDSEETEDETDVNESLNRKSRKIKESKRKFRNIKEVLRRKKLKEDYYDNYPGWDFIEETILEEIDTGDYEDKEDFIDGLMDFFEEYRDRLEDDGVEFDEIQDRLSDAWDDYYNDSEEDDIDESFKRSRNKRIKESREPLDPASIAGIEKTLKSVLYNILGSNARITVGQKSQNDSNPLSVTFFVRTNHPDIIKSINDKDYQIRRVLNKELNPMRISLRQLNSNAEKGIAEFTFDNSNFNPNNLGGRFKESKLTEKQWRYTLKSGSSLRDAIDNEDYEEIKDSLMDCYSELLNNGIIDEDDYESWTESIEMLDPDDEYTEDEFNFELSTFYDLCDNLNVWIPLSESMKRQKVKEGFEKIELETEDQVIKVESEEKPEVPGEEMIAPVEPEVKDEIETNSEEDEFEEEPEELDYDVEEFSEDEFNDLGESYLKNVYGNVKSFKTSFAGQTNNKLVVEGLITFDSGNQKKTRFVFEAHDANAKGKVRFLGENLQISRGKKSFALRGRIDNGKFISESLNYNYRAKNQEGKSVRVYGTVKH